MSPFWAPKRYQNEPVGVDLRYLFLSADVSGQRPHRTFQGKSPTGRFRGTAPQDVSANIYRKLRKYPETLRELGLTISLHRAPGNQCNRRSRASVYNYVYIMLYYIMLYYMILYYIILHYIIIIYTSLCARHKDSVPGTKTLQHPGPCSSPPLHPLPVTHIIGAKRHETAAGTDF